MNAKRLALVGLMVLSFACKKKPEDEPVATINGEAITKGQFQAQVDRNLARYRSQGNQLPPGIEQRIQESVLRRMIDDKVIAQKAAASKITITDAEVQTKFEEHKARFRTEEAFNDYLKRSNNTEANMKEDLRRNLLRDRVVETLSGPMEVSTEEVTKYFNENIERYKEKEQIRASRILIRLDANATDADKKAAQKEAKKVLAMVQKSGADFEAVAKEQSKGPEAGRGGDLGWFSRGRMPPEFETVAFALEANKISGLVQTQQGYEIIKVWEKKAERQRPLEEVQENIKNTLLARMKNDKRREVLRTLKNDAKVEQFIKFDAPVPPSIPAAPAAAANTPNGQTTAPQGMPSQAEPHSHGPGEQNHAH
jgi:peptidyl-prolyl cis-trans isomerase C